MSEQIAEMVVCRCGHEEVDHHGVDPEDGCLGVASHRLPPCPCRLTCAEVIADLATPPERTTCRTCQRPIVHSETTEGGRCEDCANDLRREVGA